jgi:hypothetical protein
MDDKLIDKLTKRLAGGRSRRTVLKGVVAGTAAVAVFNNVASAQDATPAGATPESDEDSWLLVVNFGSAEVVASEDDPTKLTITLSGIDSDPVAFTDHPQRQVANIDLGQVASAINDAADDPLNAALTARMPLSRESEQVIIVLNSAVVDEETGTLVIDAEGLGSDVEGTPVAIEPGQTTDLRGGNLFIDGVAHIIDNLSLNMLCRNEGELCTGFTPCCSGLTCLGRTPGVCVKR